MKHSSRQRPGFTLVELLVVIGIIAVLIAIVTLGYRSVTESAYRHETAAELKICSDLLAEYQSVNGLNSIEGPPGPPMTNDQMLKLPYPPWLNRWYSTPIYMDQASEVIGTQPATALGYLDFAGSRTIENGVRESADDGDLSDKSDMNNPRWSSHAVYNTTGIMFILLKNPKNRTVVSSLPPRQILETWPPTSGSPPQAAFTIDAAVPLDGWGNPIIYVPRGGMHIFMNPTNVMTKSGVGTPQEYIVRTSGTYPVKNAPLVGPNDRPFFASAGHDGYFTDVSKKTDRGLDNVYSFQQP